MHEVWNENGENKVFRYDMFIHHTIVESEEGGHEISDYLPLTKMPNVPWKYKLSQISVACPPPPKKKS